MGQNKFDPFDVTGLRRYICEMAAELADMAVGIDDQVLAEKLRAAASSRVQSLNDARLGSPDSRRKARPS